MVDGVVFGRGMESAALVRFSARRKTLALKVVEGQIVVYAPTGTSQQCINAFVQRSQSWIDKQQVKQQKQQADLADKTYTLDGQFMYLGRSYTLAQLLAEDVHTDQPLQSQLIHWFQQQAKRLLEKKTQAMAARIRQPYQGIRLGYYRSKWGSCNSKRVLSYHWAIVQAPEAVIDYLVAHEVSHLKHMNHSAQFWALVATLCPDYQVHRKWLREHGHRLRLLL